ncbi:BZ3500_MvSof-1268-A1-R1_Chr3-1g05841 [Microbotryum saponariae]|uniref:BZ3500_MvSof-1268-A1-R1_Chr3-1g05841 protein n=1 Tax=Microbotryum saponariae TaxID=289078 RepID=A0A2X0LDS9_9BASI|nr:BZ3500_MvSof-1268-A1-R1_Chr3-1g05841 [Microbotryum saponariae]SDA05031.1 BZ3501_MvSof-1269-A2-R1_Chr3-1g05511 [Microbotryum saponariae]
MTSTAPWASTSNSSSTLATDSSPSSTGSLTAPAKAAAEPKRPIAVRACDACRRRKTRCSNQTDDGSAPCSYCSSNNVPCTYEPIKRGVPLADPAELLEARIKSVTSRIQELTSDGGVNLIKMLDELIENHDHDVLWTQQGIEIEHLARQIRAERIKSLSPAGTPSSSSTTSHAIRNRGGAWDSLEDDIALDRVHYVGRGSSPFFLQKLVRDMRAPAPIIDPDEPPSLVGELLELDYLNGSKPPNTLPPPDLLRKLIDAYFTEFNDRQLPILHRPSFERALNANMHLSNKSFRGLVFMICALGSRWVEDRRIDKIIANTSDSSGKNAEPCICKGLNWYRAAVGEDFSSVAAVIPATLFDVQASVLGIFYQMGSMTLVPVWSSIGNALQKAVDVGCHRETRTRWTSSPLEDQLRKRAFHTLYSLDRAISTNLGRPTSIIDDDIDLDYPLDISDVDLDDYNLRGPKSTPPATRDPSVVALIECMSRLSRIFGQMFNALYGIHRPTTAEACTALVTDLDQQMNDWACAVPTHLRWNGEKLDPKFLTASAILYISYYELQIRIFRDFVAPSRSVLIPLRALDICAHATSSIAYINNWMLQAGRIDDLFWTVVQKMGVAFLTVLTFMFRQGASGASPVPSTLRDTRIFTHMFQKLSKHTLLAHIAMTYMRRLMETAVATYPNLIAYLETGTPGSTPPATVASTSGTTLPTRETQPAVSSAQPTEPDAERSGGPVHPTLGGVTSMLDNSQLKNAQDTVAATHPDATSAAPNDAFAPLYPQPQATDASTSLPTFQIARPSLWLPSSSFGAPSSLITNPYDPMLMSDNLRATDLTPSAAQPTSLIPGATPTQADANLLNPFDAISWNTFPTFDPTLVGDSTLTNQYFDPLAMPHDWLLRSGGFTPM